MVSSQGDQYVYCKLPLQFDQAFVTANRMDDRVQNTLEQSWIDYTMDNRNADADHQYIVIKVPPNMTCFTDGIFSLKLGLETAAGRCVVGLVYPLQQLCTIPYSTARLCCLLRLCCVLT